MLQKFYLEHVLPEIFFIFRPVSSLNNLAKLWEVDETISSNLICHVNDLLFHRIETKHLHRCQQVLGVDGGLSEASFKASEDSCDGLHLLVGQLLHLDRLGPGGGILSRVQMHSWLDFTQV